MQSVRRVQFSNIYLFFVLFSAAPAAAAFGTGRVPIKSFYESRKSHTFDLIMDICNMMLLLSYLRFDSSFFSTQLFVLKLDG